MREVYELARLEELDTDHLRFEAGLDEFDPHYERWQLLAIAMKNYRNEMGRGYTMQSLAVDALLLCMKDYDEMEREWWLATYSMEPWWSNDTGES